MKEPGHGWMWLNIGDADYMGNALVVTRNAAPRGLEEVQLIRRLYVTPSGNCAKIQMA